MTPVTTSQSHPAAPTRESSNTAEAVASLTAVALLPAETPAKVVEPLPPRQAAQEMTARAQEQTAMDFALREAEALRCQLTHERAVLAVQRANAEHARRAAENLRALHRSLLEHLAQPCFLLNDEGVVTLWNASLARWSGLSASQVIGIPLKEIACQDAYERLLQAKETIFVAPPLPPEGQEDKALIFHGPLCLLPGRKAARLTLLPLTTVGGDVEAIIALIDPSPDCPALAP